MATASVRITTKTTRTRSWKFRIALHQLIHGDHKEWHAEQDMLPEFGKPCTVSAVCKVCGKRVKMATCVASLGGVS